jgi:hypothetical protein
MQATPGRPFDRTQEHGLAPGPEAMAIQANRLRELAKWPDAEDSLYSSGTQTASLALEGAARM